MTLLADIRTALRVTTDLLDSEAQTLISAALYDMERVGVNPTLLEINEETDDLDNAFVKNAVIAYCKAQFGYDVPEATRFDDSYRRIVCDLLNSSQNIAAMDDEPESEPEPDPETDQEG